MLYATYLHAIGYYVGMCNNEIGLHLKEISLNTTREWMGVLKGQTERSGVPNGLWPLHYKVNHKSLTLQTHLTLRSLNTPAHIILATSLGPVGEHKRL